MADAKQEDAPPAESSALPGNAKLRRGYPTIGYLRQQARRRIPGFAFEYMDGGAGADGGAALGAG